MEPQETIIEQLNQDVIINLGNGEYIPPTITETELSKRNICEIGPLINSITGFKANSASPTDTWMLEFIPGVTYDGQEVKTGFFKLFINEKDGEDDISALNYEMRVYEEVTQPLVKYNMCPNFVTYLSSGKNCTYDNLKNIISFSEKPIFISNLLRNLSYMLYHKEKRPAITDEEPRKTASPGKYEDLKYNMILTKHTKGSKFSDIVPNLFNDILKGLNSELWNILFQISVGCYAMSLSKMTHNDLHGANVFIEDMGETKLLNYIINGKGSPIITKYKVLIYDFDRAFVQRFGDNEINKKYCESISQCNINIENKDIIKIFCYVFGYMFNLLEACKESLDEYMLYIEPIEQIIDKMLDFFTDNDDLKKELKDMYEYNKKEGCFLEKVVGGVLPLDFYKKYNNTFDILENIYKNTTNDSIVSGMITNKNTFRLDKEYFNDDGSIKYIHPPVRNILSEEVKVSNKTSFDEPRKKVVLSFDRTKSSVIPETIRSSSMKEKSDIVDDILTSVSNKEKFNLVKAISTKEGSEILAKAMVNNGVNTPKELPRTVKKDISSQLEVFVKTEEIKNIHLSIKDVIVDAILPSASNKEKFNLVKAISTKEGSEILAKAMVNNGVNTPKELPQDAKEKVSRKLKDVSTTQQPIVKSFVGKLYSEKPSNTLQSLLRKSTGIRKLSRKRSTKPARRSRSRKRSKKQVRSRKRSKKQVRSRKRSKKQVRSRRR